MTIEITEIDPTDEAALRSWWEVGNAASAERPFDAWPVWDVTKRAMPVPRTDGRRTLATAAVDGEVVGAAFMWLFLLDNTHLAEIDVYVAPSHRRRGVGRALLEAMEARARAAGRTTVVSSAFAPVGAESPGSLFAAAAGYPVASFEETKLIDLKVAPADWDPLDRSVAETLGDYRLRVFEDRTPEEYLDDVCTLLNAFIGNIPLGDLEIKPLAFTPERLRDEEIRHERIGRTWIVAAAVAPDGTLCGMSDVFVNRADPRQASVGITLVVPEHRGHRLGMGMKLLTHRRVMELYPECGAVVTGNAGVNAHMNAVNDLMGYQVVERCLDVQKKL